MEGAEEDIQGTFESLSLEEKNELDPDNDLVNGEADGQEDQSDYEDECCLFIGDLARSLTEDQLREPFERFGVARVEIKRDRITGYNLGYGFAQFETRQHAAEAKKGLHRSVIGGRAIRIGWAQKNTNLFIGDLDPSVTSDQLREAFSAFGPIYAEETFVKHRNYGFVRFKHRKDAERAKREMDTKMLGNRPIRIGWGDANYQRHCVHIQFDPAESSALSENDVISRFEEFGTVTSVNLPRTQGSLRGFGFIYYDDTDSGEESAAKAISALNSTEISGVLIQCNFGKKPSAKKRKTRTKRGVVGATGAIGARSPTRQQPLYPVQVMVPGPQGTWQPVQYMMTAQQAQQFYTSMQYNPQAPPAPTREGVAQPPQMMPMYYSYVDVGKDKGMPSTEEEAQGRSYSRQSPMFYPNSYSSQRQRQPLPAPPQSPPQPTRQQSLPSRGQPRAAAYYLPKNPQASAGGMPVLPDQEDGSTNY